jgi:broad specificity phosphatase PhoE
LVWNLGQMSAVELYLIRHAEADGDDAGDPALSTRGRGQAALLGSRLAGIEVAAVLHSPRLRAAQTAAILAEDLPGVPVHANDLLDDRTPVPSLRRRAEYPQHYLPWLDQTAADEQDVDAVALSRAWTGSLTRHFAELSAGRWSSSHTRS